jgi:heterodisulfide reductase subunit A
VLNSLEFERLLNADGPSKVEVLRASDGKIPRKIAWLRCVGSRNKSLDHYTYCSGVCCPYAVKQVALVKPHYPETHATIFYHDIRTIGKGFEDFYNRVQKMEGVSFVRSKISAIRGKRKNNNLIITYVSDGHTFDEEEFDMVVLSVGLRSSEANSSMNKIMGLDLNIYGFCKTAC